MSHGAAVAPDPAEPAESPSDRALMLTIEVQRERLQVATAMQQLRRAINSPDRAAEASAAHALALASGRLAGFARLLSLE